MKRQHPTDPNLFWCPKCKEYKEKNEFHKNKTNTNGITSTCKTCNCLRTKKYQTLNKEQIKERRSSYFLSHREEQRIYCKKWREKNKEQKKKNDKNWRLLNKERHYLACRKSALKNWDKVLERCRKTTEMLTPSVVRGLIYRSLKIRNPSPEFIEVYRNGTLMRRTLKQFKKWRKENESNSANV